MMNPAAYRGSSSEDDFSDTDSFLLHHIAHRGAPLTPQLHEGPSAVGLDGGGKPPHRNDGLLSERGKKIPPGMPSQGFGLSTETLDIAAPRISKSIPMTVLSLIESELTRPFRDLSTASRPAHRPSTNFLHVGLDRYSRAFIAASVVGACAVLALESYVFAQFLIKVKVLDNAHFRAIPTYFALFLFAMIYQVAVSIVAARSKNKLLVLMVIVFYYAMLLYSGIQLLEMRKSLFQGPDGMRPAKAACYAVIGVTAALAVVQTVLAYMLRDNYDWYMNKRVTSDPKVQGMFLVWEVHRTLLIFNFFFLVAFGIQFSVIMLDQRSAEFIVTICLTPVMVGVLLFADFSASREWLVGTLASMVMYLAAMAYLIFKLVRLYTKYAPSGQTLSGKKSLTTFAVLTVVFLAATMAITVAMMRNYGKGLKPYVAYSWGRRTHHPDMESEDEGMAYANNLYIE